jgi:hypothetical protein
LVPNPTQQQKAAALGGIVYDNISLKLQRTKLASEREAILKNWIRMARYFLLFVTYVRDVASKPTVKTALRMWWVNSNVLKPFSQDTFNYPSFRDLSDQAAAWVLNCCQFSTKSTKHMYFLFCLQLTTLAN